MKTMRSAISTPQIKDPNFFIELGNEAGKVGNLEESVRWYFQGLKLAKELRDSKSIDKISALIALSL